MIGVIYPSNRDQTRIDTDALPPRPGPRVIPIPIPSLKCPDLLPFRQESVRWVDTHPWGQAQPDRQGPRAGKLRFSSCCSHVLSLLSSGSGCGSLQFTNTWPAGQAAAGRKGVTCCRPLAWAVGGAVWASGRDGRLLGMMWGPASQGQRVFSRYGTASLSSTQYKQGLCRPAVPCTPHTRLLLSVASTPHLPSHAIAWRTILPSKGSTN